jgi:hypothetical protein
LRRRVASWTWAAVFFLMSLRPLSWALGNYWAAIMAERPGASDDSWAWGHTFGSSALQAWLIAGAGFWLLKPRRRREAARVDKRA